MLERSQKKEMKDDVYSVRESLNDTVMGTSRALILGAGNTVMADEGIGPRCIEALAMWFDFDDGVDLVDVGTTGLGMLDLLRDYDHLIVIDAAKDTGHPAGTVVLFTPEDLAQHQVLHTAHDMRLIDVLKSARLMGIELDSVIIVAVQVADISEWVLELTESVAEAIPVACAAALQQLEALGAAFTPKPDVVLPTALTDALTNFAPLDPAS